MLFTIWLIGALVFMTALSVFIGMRPPRGGDKWMDSEGHATTATAMLRSVLFSVLWPFSVIIWIVGFIDEIIS